MIGNRIPVESVPESSQKVNRSKLAHILIARRDLFREKLMDQKVKQKCECIPKKIRDEQIMETTPYLVIEQLPIPTFERIEEKIGRNQEQNWDTRWQYLVSNRLQIIIHRQMRVENNHAIDQWKSEKADNG